jgi:RNA polymerase sigma factor (sigma-70 family)
MNVALGEPATAAAQDRLITATVKRERGRLLAFIRRRIEDAAEAEDVLQETLYEFVAAQRLLQPIEQAGAWLLRVARNRIIDRLRRRVPLASGDAEETWEAAAESLADLLPAADAGPEAQVMRAALLEEIEAALAELPEEQRLVFVAQELEGVSFRELAARSGVSINTLIARKRYALAHLRASLQAAWDEWLLL